MSGHSTTGRSGRPSRGATTSFASPIQEVAHTQRTVQREQPASILRIKPVQHRTAAGSAQVRFGIARTTTAQGSGPKRDKGTVDVEEHERTLRQAGHHRHPTDAQAVQRPSRVSTLRNEHHAAEEQSARALPVNSAGGLLCAAGEAVGYPRPFGATPAGQQAGDGASATR